ncbi:MAG: AsmA family protein [Paracoccaceae bacterium]
MRRALKIIAVLALLAGAAVVAVVALLPAERIARLVGDQVEAATGRTLALTGSLKPSFWPVIGVETGAVALANAEWGEAPALVSAAGARIGIEVIPLLSGEIRVREVRLVDPVISLEVNEAGEANWDFGGGESADSGAGAGGNTEAFLTALKLDEAVMENGEFRYSDRRNGAAFALEQVHLTAAAPGLDSELTLSGEAVWRGEPATVALSLSTPAAALRGERVDIRLDLKSAPVSAAFDGAATPGAAPAATGAFRLSAKDPAALLAWASGGPAPAALTGVGDLSLSGDIDMGEALTLTASGGADRGGHRVEVALNARGAEGWKTNPAFTIDMEASVGALARLAYRGDIAPGDGPAPVTLKGDYTLSSAEPGAAARWALGDAPAALAGLSQLEISGPVDLSKGGLKAGAKGGVSRDGQRATLDASAAGGANWVTARAFKLNMKAALEGIATVNFAGDIAAPEGGEPTIAGALDLNAPDLRGLAAFAGAALPAGRPAAFRTLRVKGALTTPGPRSIRLEAETLALDAVAASGAVRLVLRGQPMLSANLNVGDMDLTPYLGGGGTGPSGPGWSREPIDLTGFSALDADMTLRAKSVTLPALSLGRSVIGVTLEGGQLALAVTELGFYGGGVTGDITVDGAQQGAALTADISASAVRLLPMLTALADMRSLRGRGRADLAVNGRGESLDAIMHSLDGAGTVNLTDGALVGYNLPAMARNLTSAFTGAGDDAQKTDFSEISASFRVRDGVLASQDFTLLGPLIRVTGEGVADLGAQTMNFRVVPKAVATLKGQGGKLDKDGIAFPIIISGPWANLSFRPDIEAGIRNLLTDPAGAVNTVKGLIDGGGAGALGAAAAAATKALDGAAKGDPAEAAAGALRALTGAKPSPPKPRPNAKSQQKQRQNAKQRRENRKAREAQQPPDLNDAAKSLLKP